MNKRIKIALVLVAIILIATLAISVAYSRYFTEVKASGSATVAKWSFDAKSGGNSITTATTVDLATTRTDTNNNVATNKMAPGTEGKFSIEVDATGAEVSVDYEIKFGTPTGTLPTNLKFYEDESHNTSIADITSAGLTGTIDKDATEKTKTVTLYWKWEYQTGENDTDKETNDGYDTTAGEATTTTTFDIIITGTQKQ